MKTRLLLFLFLFPDVFFSQNYYKNDAGTYVWVSAGICTSFNGSSGLRASIDLSLRQRYFFSLLTDGHVNFDGWARGTEMKANTVVWQVNRSFLIGLGNYFSPSRALVFYTGISQGEGNFRGDYLGSKTYPKVLGGTYQEKEFAYESFSYIGVPLHIKAMLTGPIAGLSFDLYYNIHKHADYGLVISLNLGWIRKRVK